MSVLFDAIKKYRAEHNNCSIETAYNGIKNQLPGIHNAMNKEAQQIKDSKRKIKRAIKILNKELFGN